MQRISHILICITLCAAANAQSMRNTFADMPDSILEIMTKINRLDCIDFIENNRTAKVRNRFDGYSILDTLTADYLRLQLTATCRVEMKLLPLTDTLCCICLSRTYAGPIEETVLNFYSSDWTPIPLESMITLPQYDDFWMENSTETADLQHLQDMHFITASLSPDNFNLIFTLLPGEVDPNKIPAFKHALHPITYEWESAKFVQSVTNDTKIQKE